MGTKECNTSTSNSKSMEGSQRLIDQSKPTTLSISECSLPQDYLRLKINSNDLHSKSYHPHNNCYSFVIEFDQPAAESLQYRINQCNRYQIISATVPIRSQLGVRDDTKQLPRTPQYMNIATPVVKSFDQRVDNESDNIGAILRSVFGLLTVATYNRLHEDLHSIHVSIDCDAFGEASHESLYKNVYTKKTPPRPQQSLGRLKQGTLIYDKGVHLLNEDMYLMNPYSIYLPQSINFKSSLLSSYPIVIRQMKQHLSSLQVNIYPNESTSTYDKHQFDIPVGLETDITLAFYNEFDKYL